METNNRILSLAIEALHLQRQKIDEEIQSLERMVNGEQRTTHRQPNGTRSKMSAEDRRKAVSEAMKKHWIERRRRMANATRSGGNRNRKSQKANS